MAERRAAEKDQRPSFSDIAGALRKRVAGEWRA